MARTGRRPGESGTRDAILAAARASFAARGYDAASVRGVARDAGVDPALVHHYFGTKAGLFAAAMELPENPARVVRAAIAEGPRSERGERLVRAVLTVWDESDRTPMLALLRSALSQAEAAAMGRQFVTDAIVGTIAEEVGGEDGVLRASLAASQVVGLIVARYIAAIEPLASTPREELVRRVGPVVQLHLEGGRA